MARDVSIYKKVEKYMEVGIGYWIGFLAFVLVMLELDLGVFHKNN